ncbi:hypothetical protein EDD36DRAFT_196558 [Exophiala viscosa]|uniref:Uncharacterized protein n=1 Tax=Exophiala viscosa TaxID=2486360 RepID=A0AAN6E351_9EURO|nr:hypothetical protein EDD36DRAFT_196558 [Exophiala viscosa]
MSSHAALYTQFSYHENDDMLQQQQDARLRATLIRESAKEIPVEERGVTEWTGVKLEHLPTSTQLMSEVHDSETIFHDALVARTYHDVLLPNKEPEDTTIPTDDTILRAHVKVLFKAFKSVPEDAEEGDEEADKTKRPFVNQVHDNHLVESLCWKILETCIYRSKKDQNLVEAWEPGKLKGKKTNFTFADRFDKVVQTMIESKSICKHLFDVNYMYKIIDDPVSAVKRVIANKRLNGKKAELMKRGKEVTEENGKTLKRPLEHGEDDDFGSRPAKTRRHAPAISSSNAHSQFRLDPATYAPNHSVTPASYTPTINTMPRSHPGNYYNTPTAQRSVYPDLSTSNTYATQAHTPTPRGLGISGLDAPRMATQSARQVQQTLTSYSSGYAGLSAYVPPHHTQSHTRSTPSFTASGSSTPSNHGAVQQWPIAAQAASSPRPYYQGTGMNTIPQGTGEFLKMENDNQEGWTAPTNSGPHDARLGWANYQEDNDDDTQQFNDDGYNYAVLAEEANEPEHTEDQP